MSADPLPFEFWCLYDQAYAAAARSAEWSLYEMRRLFATDQSALTPEFEELLVTSVEQEGLLILYEMYKILTLSGRSR
jgi:hypothetical protein